MQPLGDVLDHPFGVLVEQGIVLYDDQGVTGLFKKGHELKDCEGPADLQVLELAVHPAQDAGVVAADVEDLEPLQVQVRLRALANISFGATRALKDLGRRETEE